MPTILNNPLNAPLQFLQTYATLLWKVPISSNQAHGIQLVHYFWHLYTNVRFLHFKVQSLRLLK